MNNEFHAIIITNGYGLYSTLCTYTIYKILYSTNGTTDIHISYMFCTMFAVVAFAIICGGGAVDYFSPLSFQVFNYFENRF